MSDTTSASAAPAAPAVRFEDFGLSPDILKALAEQGYVHPTPIQAQAIPVVLQGRDVMGAAQTGTGKTAGFSLPIIQRLLQHASHSASPARHPVRALILTPTRELADQVADNVAAYCRFTPLRSTVVFGGVDMSPQPAILRAGVEIVIATPGRLLDHVQQKTVDAPKPQPGVSPAPFVSITPNEFPQPVVPGNMAFAAFDAAYSMAPYLIGPDEALVIKGRWPECVFANVCLWNRWSQMYDYVNRQVSRNRANTTLEPDGSFTMILAHEDPGLPNWIDTEGRPGIGWRLAHARDRHVAPTSS